MTNKNNKIQIDTTSFVDDIRNIFAEEILKATTQFKKQSKLNDSSFLKKLSNDDFFDTYFAFKIKFPELKKRRVIILDECKNSPLYQQNISYINDVKSIFENGNNFYPYLSKTLLDHEKDNNKVSEKKILSNYDIMLFKTKIHHIHLNSGYDNDNFINRSGSLLFCIIFNETVYFLNIDKHLSGDKEWCKKIESNLINIIKNNMDKYKELRDTYKILINDLYTIDGEDFTEEEKYKLSRIGCSVLLDGILDFGVATDGSLNLVSENRQQLYSTIHNIEYRIKNNATNIYKLSRIMTKNSKFYTNFTFSIKKENGYFIVIEKYKKELKPFLSFKILYNNYGILVNYEYQELTIEH